MSSKFAVGAAAYAKDGRSYVVEAVDGGTVYCTADNGIEADFPESSLLTEAEWRARADGRRDTAYARIKQSRAYSTAGDVRDAAAAALLLTKTERVYSSLLDFVAFTVASRILADNKDSDLQAGLSIVRSRAAFDEARVEVRAYLLAQFLGIPAATLLSAAGLGDNLLRAMLDKGMIPHADAFDAFLDRPRR